MFIAAGIIVFVLIVFIFEYRIKTPDEIVLCEKNGVVRQRKSRFYPRHFSLAMLNTTYSKLLNIEVEAKGKIPVNVKLSFTSAASENNIPKLVKVGGWNKEAVKTASKELDLILEGIIRKATETKEIEELKVDDINTHVNNALKNTGEKLGVEIVALTIQAVDPVDEKIAEAVKQIEEARILEQTELTNQKARIVATQTKIKADEEIIRMEHELAIKKYDLKKIEMGREAELAQKKLEEELKRNKMKLALDKEEVELLKENPELLMLTPQIARLAEASQNLKNAKTIVSLSSGEVEQGSQLIGAFQNFLSGLMVKKDNTKK